MVHDIQDKIDGLTCEAAIWKRDAYHERGKRVNTINNRQIVSVRIRGLAFKCLSGSRRELVLLTLKETDEKGEGNWLLLAAIFGSSGFAIGGLAAWLYLT